MTDQSLYIEIAEIIRLHMRRTVDLLHSSFVQAGLTGKISPAIWWNENGQIVGSVSVWIGEDSAEDCIDGVLALSLSGQDVEIQVDVCRSSGMLVYELFEQAVQLNAQDELTSMVETWVEAVVPELVSAIMSVVLPQELDT